MNRNYATRRHTARLHPVRLHTSRIVHLYGWLAVASARRRDMLVGMVVSSAILAVIVVTLGLLWTAALPDGETMRGYDARAMVWYVAIAEAAVMSVDQRLMQRISEEVQRGETSMQLLRPASIAWMFIAVELGRSIVRFVVQLPVCCATAWLMVGPPPSAAGMLTLAVTGPLAVIAQLLIVMVASSSVFWLGDADATWFVLQKLIFLAGGMLLPLEVWPGGVGEVLAHLPWAATAYVPAHLAVLPDASRFAELVAVQAFWILALAALATWAWSRGERRLMGAAS